MDIYSEKRGCSSPTYILHPTPGQGDVCRVPITHVGVSAMAHAEQMQTLCSQSGSRTLQGHWSIALWALIWTFFDERKFFAGLVYQIICTRWFCVPEASGIFHFLINLSCDGMPRYTGDDRHFQRKLEVN